MVPDAATDDLANYIPQPLRAHLVLEAGEAEHRQVTAAFVKFTGVDTLLAAEGANAVLGKLDALAALVGDATAELGLTWLESDIDVGGGKLYLVAGAPSSTGADEERMLRALRAVIDTHDGLTLQSRRKPRAGVLRRRRCRNAANLRGDGRHSQPRRATGVSRRRGWHPGDGRRPRPGSYALRDDTAAVPLQRQGACDHGVPGRCLARREGGQRRKPSFRLSVARHELATFAATINAARVRQQQLIEIIGEPGIGKSRLTEELKRQSLGFTQLLGRCDQYSSASPYSVFRDLLRPLAGITPDQDAAEAGAQLAPWIEAVMPDLAPLLPLLAIPFGAEVPSTPEADQIDAQFRRLRLNELVDMFLTRVLMMPTLIIIEDAHWIDDASRELILHMTRAPAPRPWLVCVTRRPQGSELSHNDIAGHVRLALEPLPIDASQTLALSAAGELALAQDVLSALIDRAGGNPLFLRELVSASRGATDIDSLPDSVETVIVARIDTLPPEDRFLLRNASVLGSRFELDLISEMLADELEDVADLERWERLHEFVSFVAPNVLGFHHDLFRAAAYEGLSFRRRRHLHARAGTALEGRGAEPSLLSLHFVNAEDHERAWDYSVEAGDAARTQYASVEASELYTRALECADRLELPPAEVARVAEALGDVAELAARYDAAENAYLRARKLTTGDAIANTRILWKEGVLCELRARYADALRRYGRALKALDGDESAAATLNRVELELAYAGVKHRQGRYPETIKRATRAAEDAERAALGAQLAHAYQLLDLAHTRLGDGDRSFRGKALPIYEEIGDLLGQARVLNNMGVYAYYEGRWDDALDCYRRGRDASERAGDIVHAATATNNEAEILSDQGRLDEARDLFDEALRVFRAANYPFGVASVTSNLARVAARSGHFEEAHALLDEALALFGEIGAESLVLETWSRKAECFVLEGRHKEALTLLRPLLADGSAAQRAVHERLAGYAVVQGRAPFAKAKPHFDASLEAARSVDAEHEVALTLRAIGETTGNGSPEADEILARLGVVQTPHVPLP